MATQEKMPNVDIRFITTHNFRFNLLTESGFATFRMKPASRPQGAAKGRLDYCVYRLNYGSSSQRRYVGDPRGRAYVQVSNARFCELTFTTDSKRVDVTYPALLLSSARRDDGIVFFIPDQSGRTVALERDVPNTLLRGNKQPTLSCVQFGGAVKLAEPLILPHLTGISPPIAQAFNQSAGIPVVKLVSKFARRITVPGTMSDGYTTGTLLLWNGASPQPIMALVSLTGYAVPESIVQRCRNPKGVTRAVYTAGYWHISPDGQSFAPATGQYKDVYDADETAKRIGDGTQWRSLVNILTNNDAHLWELVKAAQDKLSAAEAAHAVMVEHRRVAERSLTYVDRFLSTRNKDVQP